MQERGIGILKALKYLKISNKFDIIKRGTFVFCFLRRVIMRKWAVIGALAIFTCCMTACGDITGGSKEKEQVTSVSIGKDGTVDSVIVEEFQEPYYTLESLAAMIQADITAFQKEQPGTEIVLKSCESYGENQGFVKVEIFYDSDDSYTDFNHEIFFAGSIQEAYEKGFDFEMRLTKPDKEDADEEDYIIGKQELLEMSEHHIIIMEESMRVKCFDEILYVGEGVDVINDKTVDMKQTQGYGVVVFK